MTMTVSNSHRDATPGPSIFLGCFSWTEHPTDDGENHHLPPRLETSLRSPHRPLQSLASGQSDGTFVLFALLSIFLHRPLFRCSFSDCPLRGAPSLPPSPPPSSTLALPTLSKRQHAQRKRRAREKKIAHPTPSSALPPPSPSKFVLAQRRRRQRERETRIHQTLADNVDLPRHRPHPGELLHGTGQSNGMSPDFFILSLPTYHPLFLSSLTVTALPPQKHPVSHLEGAQHAPSAAVKRQRLDPTPCSPPSPPPSSTSPESTLSKRQLAQRLRRARERKAGHRPPSSAPPPPPPSKFVLAQRKRRERERQASNRRTLLEQSTVFNNGRSSPNNDANTEPNSTPSPLPLARVRYHEPFDQLSFGRMEYTCRHCTALHWLDERIKDSPLSAPLFSRCCHHGKVVLDPLPTPPQRLRSLFTAHSRDAREFREHIRRYNSALAFTSFTTKEKDNVVTGGGPWVWKSGYTIYHRVATLIPHAVDNPKYAQLYFYDPHDALDHCMNENEGVNQDTMEYLQNTVLDNNRYKFLYLHSFKILERTAFRDIQLRLVADPTTDLRRYNAPSVDEIAVIVPGDQTRAHDPRDIILHDRQGGLHFIHDHHHAYAPLHYVLLFLFGTPGWTYGLALERNKDNTALQSDNETAPDNETDRANDKHVSQVQFYSYRLHTRTNEFPIILCGGRLLQQYICDMWVSTDQNRLRWVESHQPQLRAALYSGLEDAVGHGEGDLNLADVGHRVVLPSSYIGGPRYMNQRFQDAIAVARYYHGFDLFITFTCNSQWPEIKDALLSCQSAADRPDLTVRVFNMYKNSLVKELIKDAIFGESLGYVYTIEFQKCGLPHMHLLLLLSPRFRPTSPEQVDTIIRAYWPDEQ